MGFASFPSRLSRTSRSFFGFPRWCHSRHPQPTPSQSIKIESPQGTPNKDKNMRPPTLLLLPLLSSAFTAPHYHKAGAVGTALRVAAEPETDDINLILNGNNIDLTPALSSYVEKRIGSPLRKLGSGGVVRDVDVHLSVYKNPKVKNAHRVDLTANLKGLTIHCREESPDMYASIDAVSAALQSKLSKYRQRRNDGYHAGNRMGDDLIAAIEEAAFDEVEVAEDESFVDPEKPNILKVNSYDMENAIPLRDAIFALDYVDHDFFAFKNEETGKKSVVYKRNAGGIGLIEF